MMGAGKVRLSFSLLLHCSHREGTAVQQEGQREHAEGHGPIAWRSAFRPGV
jgi:hypothetical protein